MYQTSLSTPEFLKTSYRLMLKKVLRLKEINLKKKRGKLPLPELKKKLESTSEILRAITLLISMLDFSNHETNDSVELADLLNTIGLRLTTANSELDTDKSDFQYQVIVHILEGFLNDV